MSRVKNTIREALRRFGLLTESICPNCHDPNAYVGAMSVECPNTKCKFFSQRQLDDTYVSPNADKKGKLKELLDYFGFWGADTEGDDIGYEAVDELQKKYGFQEMSDFGVGTFVVDPKNWQIISDIDQASDPKNVIQIGSYDDILMQGVSPRAKAFARSLNNPATNPGLGKVADEYDYEGAHPNIAHIFHMQNEKPECPFSREEINEILGVKDEYL